MAKSAKSAKSEIQSLSLPRLISSSGPTIWLVITKHVEKKIHACHKRAYFYVNVTISDLVGQMGPHRDVVAIGKNTPTPVHATKNQKS